LPTKSKKQNTIYIPGASSSSNHTVGLPGISDPSSTSARNRINWQLTQTASPPSHQPDLSEIQNLNQEALQAYYNTATTHGGAANHADSRVCTTNNSMAQGGLRATAE
jgi:hypothetical protein